MKQECWHRETRLRFFLWKKKRYIELPGPYRPKKNDSYFSVVKYCFYTTLSTAVTVSSENRKTVKIRNVWNSIFKSYKTRERKTTDLNSVAIDDTSRDVCFTSVLQTSEYGPHESNMPLIEFVPLQNGAEPQFYRTVFR